MVALREHAPVLRGVSKYPPAFGIDLLVDDSPGVAIEGQRHGFAVLVVEPTDSEWTVKVSSALDARGPANRVP